jgi:hypothetical protein
VIGEQGDRLFAATQHVQRQLDSFMNPSSSSTSIVPYNVDQDLIQFLPPTSHRHQQTYSERAEVKTLSPFLPARDIAARTHIALSTVKKDIKSDLPADTRAHSSRGGSKPKLSVEQESQLRAWILRLRAWEAEVTRTIVRIQALRLFSHVPFFRASCSWFRNFLKRNHLHELEVTPSHSSVTGLSSVSSSSRGSVDMLEDAKKKKELLLQFYAEFYDTKQRNNVSDHRVLAVDDLRLGHMHAKKVIDDVNVTKAKVLSVGMEYDQVNAMIPMRGDGSFGIPVLNFKGKEQLPIEHVELPASSSLLSTRPSSIAPDAPSSLPVLTCFTPTAHTSSLSYIAELETAISAALPDGGILLHDSDKAHLTKAVQGTAKRLQLLPIVTPPRLTSVGNPADRLWNALIRQSVQSQQTQYFVHLLDEGNGVIPPLSAATLRALLTAWVRNAYYSLSLRARRAAWYKAGLLLPDDKSKDSYMEVKLRAGNLCACAHVLRLRCDIAASVPLLFFFSLL